MTIREYLSHEARLITDRALTDFTDADAWRRLIPERRAQYREMMGLADLPPSSERPKLNVQVTGIVERPRYRIEKLYYESLPELYVTANLYLPNSNENATARPPFAGVLYVCGHAESQKVHYQAHPRRFAELGFACLIVETVELGEVRGHHHGCYRHGWHHWISQGYSPASIEAINGIRGLDLLCQRPDVDAGHLGVTGISGGGAVTWWIAAADERVHVAAPVCGTSTLASYITDRTIDGHCDCMWFNNSYRWDLADVGALIAPRPLLIASGDRDPIFTIASIRETHSKLERLYSTLAAADCVKLIATQTGHAYHERSRTGIFSWFARHLQGRDIPPGQIGDIDDSPEKQESQETLRVFPSGPLPEDRTPRIHEEIFVPASPPEINSIDDLRQARDRIVANLKRRTFGAFPTEAPAIETAIETEFTEGNSTGFRFAFTSEAGWRLHCVARRHKTITGPAPAILALAAPDEARGTTDRFVGQIPAPWIKVVVESRGTGDTAWGQELQWHLRRAAAWTGRTIASMRVWDTLRAIDAVQALPGVDPDQISLAAQGEMAVVALYAALLNGNVKTLILESPPATQNAASRPDGRGEAIEMLNCLTITDLPQVAGLLHPANIVFIGDRPQTYAWADAIYRKLGAPGTIQTVSDVKEWQPA